MAISPAVTLLKPCEILCKKVQFLNFTVAKFKNLSRPTVSMLPATFTT